MRPISSKFYLAIVALSLLLLCLSVLQIQPVVIKETDFLGIVSVLPFTFWIGLSLVTLGILLAYFDPNLKYGWQSLAVLLTLGLFIFGIGVFVQPNVPNPATYWISGSINYFLDYQQVDIFNFNSLTTYAAWPGTAFISISLIQATGIPLAIFANYILLVWVLATVLIILLAGKQFGFSPNQSLALTVLYLTSSWSIQTYYSPQLFAFIQFSLLFIFFASYNRGIKKRIISTIAFLALTITHGLTSLAALLSITSLELSRKKLLEIIPCLLVFAVWFIFVAHLAFESGVLRLSSQIKDMSFFTFAQSGSYEGAASFARNMSRFIRLSYPIVYASVAVIAFVLFIAKRIKGNFSRLLKCSLFWLVGSIPLVFFNYGMEVDLRLYVYALLPIATMIVAFNPPKKLLSILLVCFIFFSISARYSDLSTTQTTNTELSGAQFFAANLDSDPTYFYWNKWQYIPYFNAQIMDKHDWGARSFPTSSYASGQVNVTFFDSLNYVLDSPQGRAYYQYTYGYLPTENWKNSSMNDQIFDNGAFKIYRVCSTA